MDRHHALDNFGLHEAAMQGDEHGAWKALAAGADINALDYAGRTVVTCAVVGERQVFFSTTHTPQKDALTFYPYHQLGKYRRVRRVIHVCRQAGSPASSSRAP